MAKVRIEIDSDRFDTLFGKAALVKRFRAAAPPPTPTDDIETLDLTGMEIVAVEDEIEELELSTLEIEPVDDLEP